MRLLSTQPSRLIVLLATAMLSACGGGGGSTPSSVPQSRTLTSVEAPSTTTGPVAPTADPAPSPQPASPTTTTTTATITTVPAVTEPAPSPAPSPAPAPAAQESTLVVAGANVVTDVRFQSTAAAAQLNLPVTFGQVFAPGHVGAAQTVTGKLADGATVPLQVEVKARHADGSARHAIISAKLPALGAGQTLALALATEPATAAAPASAPTALLDAGFTASVNLDLAGVRYSASADELLRSGKYTTWLSGPLASEWLASVPLATAQGVAHPHLSARFAIRAIPGVNQARVDVTIENAWAYEPNPQNFTYDAQVMVGGQSVYTKAALNHYHHARWRKTFWWGGEPAVHVRHNIDYLIASKAVPNYDRSFTVAESALSALAAGFTGPKTEPMGTGAAMAAMPTTGGRPDIGIMPGWAANYLLSMDKRAKDVTLRTADLAGSWSAHYRNRNTDRPVSLADYPYMTILGRSSDTYNPVTKKFEAFPLCAVGTALCATPNALDSSHQPGFAYLPYLVTGDYYYLEELQFYAMWNSFSSNPAYRQTIKGLLSRDQIRGQAWSLRTLSEAAYITPDSDILKSQLSAMVGHNLTWYNANYSNNASANALGVLTSGAFAYSSGRGIAPWQDDFFTSAVGHALELGFTDAQPLLVYKTKFPILRMIGQGTCWIDGAVYSMVLQDTTAGPVYSTIAQASAASHTAVYSALECASASMATFFKLKVGEMTGYSGEVTGYPSNMQPALAYAAEVGGTEGSQAWTRFTNRTVKPNYALSPQFAIVPRMP